MKPTNQCPVYPNHMTNQPTLPVPHMSDEEVDGMLQMMKARGNLKEQEVPKTQYGRRVACNTLGKLERYK